MDKIEFDYKDEHYVLEYSRESLKMLEQRGFIVNELANKPLTMMPLAFEGLFFKNHRGIKRKLIDEIYEEFGNTEELMSFIANSISKVYEETILKKEANSGNIDWKIVSFKKQK